MNDRLYYAPVSTLPLTSYSMFWSEYNGRTIIV